MKSYEEVIEYTMEQMPFPMTSTKVWMKPSFEGTKMDDEFPFIIDELSKTKNQMYSFSESYFRYDLYLVQ